MFFAFSEEGDAKSLQSHWKNPHFEYAFSYFQQMVRDAVDGRTINVVLLSLKLLFLEIFKFFTLCALWHGTVGLKLSTTQKKCYQVKGVSWNPRKVKRKFSIVRIGRFCRFQRYKTGKICEISWVVINNSWNENSACQLTQNSNAAWNFC